MGRTYYKKSVSEKIKEINNKIKQNKAQYDLDGQTAKSSALSSANVSKHEFLTSKDVLLKEDLLEKAATLKRFEYSPLEIELKDWHCKEIISKLLFLIRVTKILMSH